MQSRNLFADFDEVQNSWTAAVQRIDVEFLQATVKVVAESVKQNEHTISQVLNMKPTNSKSSKQFFLKHVVGVKATQIIQELMPLQEVERRFPHRLLLP